MTAVERLAGLWVRSVERWPVLATLGPFLPLLLLWWAVAAAEIFRKEPKRAANIVGNFFRGRGQKVSDEVYLRAMRRMDVTTSYRPELKKYLAEIAQVLLKQNRLTKMPDLDRALDERILKKVA
ncbi:MAG: hypothetical protein K6T74_05630 [Geminicoccaceae bacterium]|nr:hypothetical protein [Geminicoccaceae bacterium]